MIVEPPPPFPGRIESSGPGPVRPSPAAGDDAFGRTLSDALRADRAARSRDRSRRRTGPDDDRGTGAAVRRDGRSETNENRGDRRVGADDPAATNRSTSESEPAHGDTAEEQPTADGDRSNGPSRRESASAEADAAEEPVVRQPQAVEVAAAAGPTSALEAFHIDTPVDGAATEQDGVTEPALAAGSSETGPVDAIESAVTAATASGDTVDSLPADPDSIGDGVVGATPIGISDDGAGGIELAGTDDADGADDEAKTAEPINRPASNVGPAVEPAESSDEVAETGGGLTGRTGDPSITAESTMAESTESVAASAAMAGRRPSSVPDSDSTNAAASSSTEVSDAAGVAPLGRQPSAGEPEVETNPPTRNLSPDPDATDLVDRAEGQPEADGNQTVEQPTRLGNDRPAPGLAAAPSLGAPVSSTIRPTAAGAETSNSTPELVELQTAGLAERLRPAFAAVRRGVNGLDELRLRIQDDNAGPIKVDIATIDNRVRVLLSAANDDLMRQLGQERDRLADELRRAGFDQASIDIEANDPGKRHGHYDQEESGRAGSGATGSGSPAATATGLVERASSRRHRSLTGLDLDL